MTPPKSVGAIIFDFDGVIADSEIVSSRSFSEALTAAGLPTTLDEAVDRYTGLHRADTLAAIAAFWGEQTPHDIAQRISDHADLLFGLGLTPIPGAVDFIGAAGHLPLAIGSSSRTAYLNKHLADFKLAQAFGAHVYSGSEHVARGKPHPDIYLHAAQALGVHPSQAVILEDSPVGARAAVAAGAHVIGFTGGSHARPSLTDGLRAEGVAVVLDSYEAVAAHLGLAMPIRTAG